MLFSGIALSAFAQKQVSGTVKDESGDPLPGVSVIISGTSVGTATDASGKYTISVKQADATLVFSFYGMRNVTMPVGSKSVIDVTMQQDAIGLDATVITATGMTRQEKTLGYATTTIRSDEISRARSADALSGLTGKVAGMQISSAGGTGTSQKVIVRGYSSLNGSNQPLYVVDGSPITNTTMGVQELDNAIDFGNSAQDINPEDIASITVLKGASATALYGSRAANGVILITTKKGMQNERVTVTYTGSATASSVLRIPQIQNKFGQGWFYDYDYSYYSVGNPFQNYSYTENGSWGNLLDGRTVEWRPGAAWYDGADPSYTKFAYKKNSLKNFYTTGLELNNNISIQGGSKNSGFVVSYGNVTSDGILPGKNDYYKRNNFSVRGNTKLFEGISWVNYSANYVRKNVRNAMSGQGGDGSVIYQDILQYPVNVDYADIKDWKNVYNNADNFYTPYAQNPWWILDHNYSEYQEDRVYGNAEVGFQLYKGLQLIGRLGFDATNNVQKTYNDVFRFNTVSYAADEGASPEIGSYNEYVYRNTQTDANVFLNGDYTIANDWSVHGVLGWNLNERSAYAITGNVQGLAIENYPNFDNVQSAAAVASSSISKRRLVGLYGQADFGWRNAAFLSVSARNDWSSTLPINNNSFFYWGVNASAILTDLIPSLKNDILSFAKIRGGFGQTGNDASTYLTSPYYYLASSTGGFGSLTFPLNSFSGFSQSANLPATTLKPEISTEAEVGADIRLFNNRLSFDAAYYDKNTRNQIISSSMAPESGFSSRVRNVGKIRNRGVELTISGIPVRTRDFEWNVGYTFSRNKNTVEELWDDVTESTIYGLSTGPQLKAIVGKPLGTWVDYKLLTVEDKTSPYYGYTIVNPSSGYPKYSNTELEVLGNADPKFVMGLSNSFTWKDFTLGFTLDWRHGGKMYSATKSIVMFDGNDESTMFNLRDAWVWPHSVIETEDASGNTVYVENNLPVDTYTTLNGAYYSNYNYARYRDDLLDKGYLKLRELSFTYKLPRKLFENIDWLTGIDVSVIGRNLLMWTPKQGLIDPDITNYGNDLTSQYGEYYSAPSIRSIGASIKVVF